MIKRERFLLDAIEIALKHVDKETAEKINALQDQWQTKMDEQDQSDYGTLGILSLHPSQVSESLFDKLFNDNYDTIIHKYEDIDGAEHLFGVNVHEHLEKAGAELTESELKELEDLRQRMAEEDCGYFRFIA